MTDLRSVILRAKRATIVLKLIVFGYLPNCPKSTLESAAAGAMSQKFKHRANNLKIGRKTRKKIYIIFGVKIQIVIF